MKISTRNLHKSFRDADHSLTVLDALTYDFPESSSIAIVGRSGIGKSTLLHVLGGLDRATSGSVFYDGLDICALDAEALSRFRGASVGFVFQSHHLLPEFTALENVAMPLLIGGHSETRATQAAKELLERVGLGERLSHIPGKLSGGEQQRVSIARAVVTRPAVLLADEPTGNLDAGTAQDCQALLLGMQRELRNTLIVVTHSAELASAMDVVLEMHEGGSLESRLEKN